MPEDTPEHTQRDLSERWNNPTLGLRPPLGRPGYRLPPLHAFQWHRMPGAGRGNWILAGESFPQQYEYDVGPDCCNNILVIEPQSACRGRLFIRGSNNIAIIRGSHLTHSPINVHFHSSQHVFFFGLHATSNTATFEMGTDRTSIIVGEDCMFSAAIDVSTDDQHAIVDMASGEHINAARDILIEPHGWIGMHCMILKGVRIGFGAIVGARSLVTKDIPRRSLAVGSPAVVVRSNVGWIRDRCSDAHSAAYISQLEQQFELEPWDHAGASASSVRRA